MDYLISAAPIFLAGVAVGIIAMALYNKVRGGAANPATTKEAFDQYKADVAEHFTETGKKFQSMANQYQELYEHLAVGAHTLLDNETADKLLAPPKKSELAGGERAQQGSGSNASQQGKQPVKPKASDQSNTSKSTKAEGTTSNATAARRESPSKSS